jgi:Glutathione S-transferase, C-terminal domain
LNVLASGDTFIVGSSLSLADLHLGSMIAYFSLASEGAALLAEHPQLVLVAPSIVTREFCCNRPLSSRLRDAILTRNRE